MKCLSIKQPWASLICGGVKDVENRSWRQKDIPGRILIHAGAKRMLSSFNDTLIHEEVLIVNAIIEGYCPQLNETPTSAIIGYADVVDFVEESDSDWAQDGEGAQWKWVMANAKLFKEPIPYKGKLGLFEVPEIDENNLPEVWDFPQIERDGDKLKMPVSNMEFENMKTLLTPPVIEGETIFSFYLTNANLKYFADEILNPIETKSLILVNSETGESLNTKVVETDIIDITYDDEPEKPVIYQNYKGQELSWVEICYKLR